MHEIAPTALSEIVEIQQGRYLSKEEMAEEASAEFPIPVHGANGIIGWTTEPMYAEGVPLVTCRGSNSGMVLWANGPLWVSNNAMAILPRSGNNRFVFYSLLNAPPYSVVTGSAQPQITRRDLVGHRISWASPLQQEAIASVLGALDEKIELNRRMNQTLEAMARAIFKDWFVDFGPTRAKMEGSAPYLALDIWSLFPDRLNDEGKPKGWEEKRVEDILELAYGKALKASDRTDGPVPVYGSGGITGYHNEALVDGPSVIVGRKGTVGVLYWEDRPFFPIDTVFYVRPKTQLTFCYYHLQTLGLEAMNTDAAVPGLNRNNVYRLSVPWSDEKLRTQFHLLAEPLRQRIRANSEEIEALATMRDFLLPKLMSGEVRVKDAEKFIGEAT